MICISDCALCIHQRQELIKDWIPTCDAFPNGKPHGWEFSDVKPQKECNNGIGFEPIDEFVSESLAEYANSPRKARATAKSVAKILLRK